MIRKAVAAMLLIPFVANAESRPTVSTTVSPIEKLERETSGKIGVSMLGAVASPVENRGDERFPMCSTFKFLLAAQVLKRVDLGEEKLDRVVRFTKQDLLEYAPITTKALSRGSMTVGELCAAALQYSDNTAANLLLKTQGGPAGLTKYLHSLGDNVSRLDRTEPSLNVMIEGKDLDTTTPRAMTANLKKLLLGDALSEKSREQLKQWMLLNTTGDRRLRAGVPAGWKVADKTGRCGQGTMGDVAILYPPKASPLVIAVFISQAATTAEKTEATFADIARLISK